MIATENLSSQEMLVRIAKEEILYLRLPHLVLEEITHAVAQEYIKNHMKELLETIDIKAIVEATIKIVSEKTAERMNVSLTPANSGETL